MATNWTKNATASAQGFDNRGTKNSPWTQAVTGIVSGQVLFATFFTFFSGGDPTSFSITDNGSAGWTVVSGGNFNGWMWMKVATPADVAGITVTFSCSGQIGNANFASWVIDCFSSPSGGIGLDLTGNQFANSTTATAHPGSGSSKPTYTDELAYCVVNSSNMGARGATNNFIGTSGTTGLTLSQQNNDGGAGNYQMSQYVGGVQASATAASDSWVASWATSGNAFLIGATVYHAEVHAQGNMLAVLGV